MLQNIIFVLFVSVYVIVAPKLCIVKLFWQLQKRIVRTIRGRARLSQAVVRESGHVRLRNLDGMIMWLMHL